MNKRNLEIEDEHKYKNCKNKENAPMMWMPICMCLGLSIGMSLGRLIFDNTSIGMCVGISLGVAVGSAIDAKNKTGSPTSCESDKDEENK